MTVISLIIIKHKGVRTGSIWKCLIFWWWHNVSTNALGLLWLTLTRNNLRDKREQRDVRKNRVKENFTHFLYCWADRKTYPSTCPCWWMMRWDSSLVILPWNHSWAIWMTAERPNMLKKPTLKPTNASIRSPLDLPEFNEEWWSGLWEPKMFILWVLFWERCQKDE